MAYCRVLFWKSAVTLAFLLPTLAYAASISAPPAEFFTAFPLTSAWIFGAILMAFIGAVGIIAKLVKDSISRSIASSEKVNEAQWLEIKSLAKYAGKLDRRLISVEIHCDRNHPGGRREYDPERRLGADDE